jgi:flavin reductase (DIM6/NTAB) family NADH-FMN oxidoreductase RutF
MAVPEAAVPVGHTTLSAPSAALFRKVMSRFATGVTVVTTELGGEIFGMTANAFMAGSLSPPLCVISIGHGAKMHERLIATRQFGVSFLSEQQADIAQHFAGRASGFVKPVFRRLGDVPVLANSIGMVAADVVDTAECGDHTMFIGRIAELEVEDRTPLLFYAGAYAAVDREQRLERVRTISFW